MGKINIKLAFMALVLAVSGGVFYAPGVEADAEEGVSVASETVGVATFEELLAAFDATWEDGDPGVKNVMLSGDIVQGEGDTDYLSVNTGWTVNLNLAGHTLVLRNDGKRGLLNYGGTLTVTGDGIITNTEDNTQNESYGLIDNLGGKVVIENGTFVDYGQGGGATFKNRTVSLDGGETYLTGELVIKSAKINVHATAGGNACVDSDGVLTVYDGVEMANEATDEVHNGYYGAYALSVRGGSATIGTTAGKVANPVKVNGNRGGLAVNSGTVTVNNGVFTGNLYYGMWITNNGGISDVTVKYAEVEGAKYGLYSTVDDGKQDLSDVGIVIENGVYRGGTGAAVAVNGNKSEHSFGIAISGGEFNTVPDASYIVEGHDVYALSDEGPYVVAPVTEPELPNIVYLAKGEMYDLGAGLDAVAKEFGTFGVEDKNVASLGEDGLTIVGEATGSTLVNFQLHNLNGGYEQTFEVVVYDMAVSEDSDVQDSEVATVKDWAAEQVGVLLMSGANENEYLILAGAHEIDGVEYNGVELVKKMLADGAELKTVVTTDNEVAEDDWGFVEAYDPIVWQLGEKEAIAAIYNGFVDLYADDVYLGRMLELAEPIEMRLKVPEEFLNVPEGVERKFAVVRGHVDIDGVATAERMDAALDGGYLVFENQKFSSFAIVYTDVNVETGEIVAPTPNTGVFTVGTIESRSREDYRGLIGAIVTMVSVMGVMGAFRGYRRLQRWIYRGK